MLFLLRVHGAGMYLCQCDKFKSIGPPPGCVGIEVVPHRQCVFHYLHKLLALPQLLTRLAGQLQSLNGMQ